MTDDPVARLKAGLDADEAWALAASGPYKYADGQPPAPLGGVHWRWGAGEDWEHAEPDPGADIIGEYGCNVQLLTVEEWPAYDGQWMMHRAYSDHIVEMDSAAAGHILRQDPARTLRRVAAMREILDKYEGLEAACRNARYGAAVIVARDTLKQAVLALAAIYSDENFADAYSDDPA